MINRIGYACINSSIKENFKDCRLKSVYTRGISSLKDITLNNLMVTEKTLRWNIKNNIFMYRATSKMIPFATHSDIIKDFSFRWYEDIDILNSLKKIREIVLNNNIRLSMHPDQFTVLNSPDENIVEKAVINLKYHRDLLVLMGGTDLIIHTGGVYGDKADASARFINSYLNLEEDVRKYVRLENDDISYDLKDVLRISDNCGIPVVLDIHHHNCKNDGNYDIKNLIPHINESWQTAGIIPKCHISTGLTKYNDKRHHNMVSAADFFAFCDLTDGIDVDLMVEAKMKEQAVLYLTSLLKI